MKDFVIFENSGEIDSRLITTFGVNVKDGDGAIGFFGTGLKYALSILMREGCEVTIQSGLEQHKFGKQSIELRGKPFEFVTMNDATLGFTTEVGKKWELWMAYRELFCNAQDEGGEVFRADAMPEPREGFTRVIVTGEKFTDIADNHEKYFLTSAPHLVCERVNVHKGHAHGVYYRNVLVGKLSERPTLFTYNITGNADLTEDRTLKYSWIVASRIATAVVSSNNVDFVRACVMAKEDFHESVLDYDNDDEPSAEFMQIMASLVSDRIGSVSQSALKKYRKHSGKGAKPEVVILNHIEQAVLEKSKQFCKKIGFDIHYQILVVESLGADILGMALEDTIYLSHRTFMIGTKSVAGTIIEEYIHLKHGYADCTRNFQNYVLDKMVSLGELVTGEPL